MEVFVRDEAQPALVAARFSERAGVEGHGRRVQVLEPAAAGADNEERVMAVGELAHERGRGLDDSLEVARELGPVRCAEVVRGDGVGEAGGLESQDLLVADEDRAVVERIEVGRDESVGPSRDGVEPGRNALPVGVGEDGDGHRVLEAAGDVHEDAGRGDEAAVVAEVAVGDEAGEGVDIVARDDGGGLSGADAPDVLGGFLPGEGTAGAVHGLEVLDVLGVVHDPVVARRPGRHLEVLDLALEAVGAEDDVVVVGRRPLHGHGDGQGGRRRGAGLG